MSELIFKFATRELILIKELSYYNHVAYKVKGSKFCFDHIKEIYDDVSDSPIYEFGVVKDEKFKCLFSGEGDPIPEGKENTGGVYVNVYIHYPEHLNLKKESKGVQ